MAQIKIYISLQEAEQLIFERLVALPLNRTQVKRAQGLMSVAVSVTESKLITKDQFIVVLFSAVTIFEIPEKDQSLFLNHYRLPQGLIEPVNRKFKDISNESELISEDPFPIDGPMYSKLRNGLYGLSQLAYNRIDEKKISADVEDIINNFSNLSKFRQVFLSEVLNNEHFPKLIVHTDNVAPEIFFRRTWWGKFTADNYINQITEIGIEEIEAAKSWLRKFLKIDITEINSLITDTPSIMREEMNFILGYYFTVNYYESLQSDINFFDELYESIEYGKKNKLAAWIKFFQSLFDESITYLYFIPALNDNLYKLEKLAFDLTLSNFVSENESDTNFKITAIEENELLSSFLMLTTGIPSQVPQLIGDTEARKIFNNNFSHDKLSRHGFELKSEYENSSVLKNTCWLSRSKFHLNLDVDTNLNDIVFFTSDNPALKSKLKALKLKEKPYSKLLDKNKKVLVGFIDGAQQPKLALLYSTFLKQEITTRFEKAVFVLLVDLDPEKLQALEFVDYKRKLQNDIRTLFDIDIELITKNQRTQGDAEIKRNLKNALKTYKVENIEVIDENFDEAKAVWLIECGTEYIVKREGQNFYYINTL